MTTGTDGKMKAVFEAQAAEWQAHSATVLARAAELGIAIDSSGGNCPVQIEGSFDGLRFYFRARGNAWSFQAAPSDGEIDAGAELFGIEREYRDGAADAGWMPLHEAIGLVCDCVSECRGQAAAGQPPHGGR